MYLQWLHPTFWGWDLPRVLKPWLCLVPSMFGRFVWPISQGFPSATRCLSGAPSMASGRAVDLGCWELVCLQLHVFQLMMVSRINRCVVRYSLVQLDFGWCLYIMNYYDHLYMTPKWVTGIVLLGKTWKGWPELDSWSPVDVVVPNLDEGVAMKGIGSPQLPRGQPKPPLFCKAASFHPPSFGL